MAALTVCQHLGHNRCFSCHVCRLTREERAERWKGQGLGDQALKTRLAVALAGLRGQFLSKHTLILETRRSRNVTSGGNWSRNTAPRVSSTAKLRSNLLRSKWFSRVTATRSAPPPASVGIRKRTRLRWGLHACFQLANESLRCCARSILEHAFPHFRDTLQ